MFHELVLAIAFVVMIAAPAVITISPDRDERDRL